MPFPIYRKHYVAKEKQRGCEPQQGMDHEKRDDLQLVRPVENLDFLLKRENIALGRKAALRNREKSTKTWTLLNLPHVVEELIFSNLDAKELTWLGMTNRSLQKSTETSTVWRMLYYRDFGVVLKSRSLNHQDSINRIHSAPESRGLSSIPTTQIQNRTHREQYLSHYSEFKARQANRTMWRKKLEDSYATALRRYSVQKTLDMFYIRGIAVITAVIPITFIVLCHQKANFGNISSFAVISPLLVLGCWLAVMLVVDLILYCMRKTDGSVCFELWGTQPLLTKSFMAVTATSFWLATFTEWLVLGLALCYIVLIASRIYCTENCMEWIAVQSPLYVLSVIYLVGSLRFWKVCEAVHKHKVLFANLIVNVLCTTTVLLVAVYLDGYLTTTLYATLSPLWSLDIVLVILPIIYAIRSRFKNEENSGENAVGAILWVLILSPLFAFEFFLCEWALSKKEQGHEKSPDDIFIPLFVWFGLLGFFLLLSAFSYESSATCPEKMSALPYNQLDGYETRMQDNKQFWERESLTSNQRISLRGSPPANELESFNQLTRLGTFSLDRRPDLEQSHSQNETSLMGAIGHFSSSAQSTRASQENVDEVDANSTVSNVVPEQSSASAELPFEVQQGEDETVREAVIQTALEWGMTAEELLATNMEWDFVSSVEEADIMQVSGSVFLDVNEEEEKVDEVSNQELATT